MNQVKCPVCGRNKKEILRWIRKKKNHTKDDLFLPTDEKLDKSDFKKNIYGEWSASLHTHHDHGNRWFGQEIICGDCNTADGITKRLLKLPFDWSFSADELKQFVREKASTNAPFRNLFLSSFAQHNSDESKELYVKQVKSILKTASDRHGFIDWSASRIVGNAIDNLLESAQKQINNRNYESAVFICTAVMEQMTEALQYSDDSNGDIGGSVDAAYEKQQNRRAA